MEHDNYNNKVGRNKVGKQDGDATPKKKVTWRRGGQRHLPDKLQMGQR